MNCPLSAVVKIIYRGDFLAKVVKISSHWRFKGPFPYTRVTACGLWAAGWGCYPFHASGVYHADCGSKVLFGSEVTLVKVKVMSGLPALSPWRLRISHALYFRGPRGDANLQGWSGQKIILLNIENSMNSN